VPSGLEVQRIYACPVRDALGYKIQRDIDHGALEGIPPKMKKVPAKVT
jgi:hypothetical protein